MTSNNRQEWSPETFGNEERLPRVPLPGLDDSCRRFVEWCTPLLDADELAETEAAVSAFLHPDSPAHALQSAVEQYDAEPDVHSWLDRFWPTRYLGRRDRIALNANFFFLFRESDAGQVRRSADLIGAALDYKLLLDGERLPVTFQRGRPTSMVQNRFLFSTTRIPGDAQDTVRAPYTEQWPGPSRARHIVVFFRGNAFRMDVLGPDGRPHSPEDLEAALAAVMAAGATRAAPGTSVGQLTTKARAEWAADRRRLLEIDPANPETLEVIETALFCLCLEDITPGDEQEACDLLLHGDSANRWFDKALSLVVFADGTAGINVEHCELDGTTILNLVDAMLDEPPEAHAARSGAASQGVPAVDPIGFVLDDDLRAAVQEAGDDFARYAAATATLAVSLPGVGRDRAKELGMSPDAFAHMAFQIAHHRARGNVGATYESIATRQYRHGRTEAMRVITPEILHLVAVMDDPDTDRAGRLAALRSAADRHVARIKECQEGKAPEQHLWELQLVAQRLGRAQEAPEDLALYRSPGWLKMRDDLLSTSSAPSANIRYFGFGSTGARCIGVAYVLLPDRLKLYLSAPQAIADEMHLFAEKLEGAFREIEDLLVDEHAGSRAVS